MARAAVGWSQAQLAEAADVRQETVSGYEAGRSDPRASTIDALRKALERAGVVFVSEGEASIAGGAGVRLRTKADVE